MPILLENSLAHTNDLVALWNECTVDPFWMDERLMSQYLEHPGADVWVTDKPWNGALWARNGQQGITLDAILVRPELRRQGLGRALLADFIASVPQGVAWRFGGGAHHFVPGLPESLSWAESFFVKQGLVADWHAHDLLWTSRSGGATSWDTSTYRLLGASESEALLQLMQNFGQRWQVDTASRCQALREGSFEETMGAFHEGELVGFCHIWSARSRRLGPSTFWLARDSQAAWGGIGPLGVHPDLRGHGYGAGVVEAAMAYLREVGVETIGVDWTGLPEFYEGRGFSRWLTYRGFHPKNS